VELEVRSALLELQSSEQQYKVAQSALALVRQQLDQAQDRFAAGVANNLEVVQAQEAVALADENIIRSYVWIQCGACRIGSRHRCDGEVRGRRVWKG
jgi:outer membrane protein TolC